jgi:hypothetical protein
MSSDIKRNTEKYPHIMRSGRIPTILAHSIVEKEYGSWNNAINEIFYDRKSSEVEMKYLIAEVKRFKDENMAGSQRKRYERIKWLS